jgi:putative colanic acid biosynthesis UDP-glucose lipid carrier transferase
MSLIGPRPYMISDNQKFESMIEQYSLRYKVKPGITGLAQVLGYVGPIADEESMKERIRHDMYYIYHWTAALDIKIVCRTFFKMMGIK